MLFNAAVVPLQALSLLLLPLPWTLPRLLAVQVGQWGRWGGERGGGRLAVCMWFGCGFGSLCA